MIVICFLTLETLLQAWGPCSQPGKKSKKNMQNPKQQIIYPKITYPLGPNERPPAIYPPGYIIGGGGVATIRGAIVATNAGTTPVGMATAFAYGHAPGQYKIVVGSGVGTSKEGEALTRIQCARTTQQGVYYVVPDSEPAVGTLCTNHEGGHCGDGIHHLGARTLGAERLALGLRSISWSRPPTG